MPSEPSFLLLSELTSSSTEWVAAFGLSRQNVLDYFSEVGSTTSSAEGRGAEFSQSPFFDRQSTNQQLRMQTRFQMPDEAYNVEQQLTCVRLARICSSVKIEVGAQAAHRHRVSRCRSLAARSLRHRQALSL